MCLALLEAGVMGLILLGFDCFSELKSQSVPVQGLPVQGLPVQGLPVQGLPSYVMLVVCSHLLVPVTVTVTVTLTLTLILL